MLPNNALLGTRHKWRAPQSADVRSTKIHTHNMPEEKDRRKWVPDNADEYAEFLKSFMLKHRIIKETEKANKNRRVPLTSDERRIILEKTNGRCHLCGGNIKNSWDADHVLAHSGGGGHSVDNYLPAHSICNSYKWDYIPEEFQEILRIGVWAKTQIRNRTVVGRAVAESFIKHEKNRINRRQLDKSEQCVAPYVAQGAPSGER